MSAASKIEHPAFDRLSNKACSAKSSPDGKKRIIALSDVHLEDGEIPLALIALLKKSNIILYARDFVIASAFTALSHLSRIETVCGNSDCKWVSRGFCRKEPCLACHGPDLVGAVMIAR